MRFQELKTERIFNISIHYIINILIVYIIVLLLVGLGKTLLGMQSLLNHEPIGKAFTSIVTDILTFLVIIELFRTFIEYFKARRFRLNNMMDPAIILVVRELVVALHKHTHLVWQELIGYSGIILSLGIVRTLAIRFSPMEHAHATPDTKKYPGHPS